MYISSVFFAATLTLQGVQLPLQIAPDAFQQRQPEIGEGLETFSEALHNSLRWADDAHTQFSGSRWTGGRTVLTGYDFPDEPFDYAVASLSATTKQSCTFIGPNFRVQYEGVNAGSFPVRCGPNTILFSFLQTPGRLELHYFQRDGTQMADAEVDERRGIRQLFVAMDQLASVRGLAQPVPLSVTDRAGVPE
tara:strand:- start:438 stop:1013 length:576 start_codon:yes stop_codon:yes gene_type:complete